MLIKAVVVAYNGLQWIDRCLGSLRDPVIRVETVVVDNGSTDGTIEAIRERFPEVELIVSKENLGFGKANNIGMRMALEQGADHAYLLNQDAWLAPGALTKLISAAKAEPQYGILSPLQLNGDGTALDYDSMLYLVPTKCPGIFSDLSLGRVDNKIYNLKFVNAAAWLITRACLEKVGGFSPSFFHYGEDDNYLHRVFHHGFQCGILPSAIAYHDREDRGDNPYFVDVPRSMARKAVVEFSDPQRMLDPGREKLFLMRQIAQRMISGQMSELRNLRLRLRALNSLPVRTVLENRAISKGAGPSFL